MVVHLARDAVVAALVILSLMGCSGDRNGSSVSEIRWQEQVRLASGESITVRRQVRFRDEGAFGGGYSTGQAFENSDLEWEVGPGEVAKWQAPMRALFLDHDPDNGEWLVIAAGGPAAEFWDLNGSPCPPQWAFRLRKGIWYVQPVPVVLVGRRPNLLLEFQVTDDQKFTEATFEEEVRRRKERFETRPMPYELRTYSVGAVGQIEVCRGRAPQFTKPFIVNKTIPGISQFPRLP